MTNSPMPSRRCSGSRSRALRPIDRATAPIAWAMPSQTAATPRPSAANARNTGPGPLRTARGAGRRVRVGARLLEDRLFRPGRTPGSGARTSVPPDRDRPDLDVLLLREPGGEDVRVAMAPNVCHRHSSHTDHRPCHRASLSHRSRRGVSPRSPGLHLGPPSGLLRAARTRIRHSMKRTHVKRLALVAGLALVGSALSVVPQPAGHRCRPHPDGTPVDRVADEGPGLRHHEVSVEKSTGKVGFIRTSAGKDLLPGVAASARRRRRQGRRLPRRVLHRLRRGQGRAHRAGVAKNTLRLHRPATSSATRACRSSVPGSCANFDNTGNLRAVNGFAAPGLDLSTTPRLRPPRPPRPPSPGSPRPAHGARRPRPT